MDNITYRYYLAEGDQAKAVITEANALKTAHLERISALIQKYGADCAWGGSRSPLCGLGFRCESDTPLTLKDGFKPPTREKSGEEYYSVYIPNMRFKEGKAIKADMIRAGVFNFSDHVTEKLGIYCDCFGIFNGNMVRAFSAAGQYGDRLLFRIPFGGDSRPRDIQFPDFVKEIKESEFIAITKEGA